MVRFAVFLLAIIPLAVQAAPLADPLRPARDLSPQAVVEQVEKKQAVVEPDLQLNAILFSASRSVAVIDGRSLQVGERINDYRLVAIERDQVVLKKKQKVLVLRRPGSGLKTDSAETVAVKKGNRRDSLKTY